MRMLRAIDLQRNPKLSSTRAIASVSVYARPCSSSRKETGSCGSIPCSRSRSCPVALCMAAKRKTPRRSCRRTKLTQRLHSTHAPSKTMTLFDSTFMLDHPAAIADQQSDSAHLGADVESILCAVSRFVSLASREPRCRQGKQEKTRPAQQPCDPLGGCRELESERDRAKSFFEDAASVPEHGGHLMRAESARPRFTAAPALDGDLDVDVLVRRRQPSDRREYARKDAAPAFDRASPRISLARSGVMDAL